MPSALKCLTRVEPWGRGIAGSAAKSSPPRIRPQTLGVLDQDAEKDAAFAIRLVRTPEPELVVAEKFQEQTPP